MNKEVFQYVDHTLLAQDSTWAQIKEICDDAIAYGTASVCIPPSFVKRAKEYVGDKMAGLYRDRFPEWLQHNRCKSI